VNFYASITSTTNATVKDVVRLHNRRHRRNTGRMVIDGIRPTLLALRSNYPLETVFVCPERLPPTDAEQEELITRLAESGMPLTRLSTAAIDKMACRENADGILATALTPSAPLERFDPPKNALLLLIEGVEKPGNLGAMLRTAEGAGVDGVIICDPLIDLGNPNVVRASMGTVFTCPVAVTTGDEAIAWLSKRGGRIISASPEGTGLYWDADMRGPVAIAVGAEHAGLSPIFRKNHNNVSCVSIPMHGEADSLNVATAAALLIYEALRQRR
jgi:TrmH family RNA methyltransferase